MSPDLRKMVIDRDEVGLEHAYFKDECSQFFQVDWREYDDDTVAYCAHALGINTLTAEYCDEMLFITFEGRKVQVPLQNDVADRHITICTLNDLLSPTYEVRHLVISGGSDTLGFAALSVADWRELEKASAAFVAENFIDPRKLPNLMTELTIANLPAIARARFERMISRYKSK